MENLLFLCVPILKHIRVMDLYKTVCKENEDVYNVVFSFKHVSCSISIYVSTGV